MDPIGALTEPAVVIVYGGLAVFVGWLANRRRGPLSARQVRAPGYYVGVAIVTILLSGLIALAGVMGGAASPASDQFPPWALLVVSFGGGGLWLAITSYRADLSYDDSHIRWTHGLFASGRTAWYEFIRVRYSRMRRAFVFETRTGEKLVVYDTYEGLDGLLMTAAAKGLILPQHTKRLG